MTDDLGIKKIVEMLINKGVDLSAKDKVEWTALHRAAYAGHDEIVQLLIEKGADPNLKDDAGRTPLYLSAIEGLFQIEESFEIERKELINSN